MQCWFQAAWTCPCLKLNNKCGGLFAGVNKDLVAPLAAAGELQGCLVPCEVCEVHHPMFWGSSWALAAENSALFSESVTGCCSWTYSAGVEPLENKYCLGEQRALRDLWDVTAFCLADKLQCSRKDATMSIDFFCAWNSFCSSLWIAFMSWQSIKDHFVCLFLHYCFFYCFLLYCL